MALTVERAVKRGLPGTSPEKHFLTSPHTHPTHSLISAPKSFDSTFDLTPLFGGWFLRPKLCFCISSLSTRRREGKTHRLRFFGGGDAREYPGGLLRLDPAFAYAEPPSS